MPAVADARRRLLRPGGIIIPRAATMWGCFVEYKLPLDCAELELFYADDSARRAPRHTITSSPPRRKSKVIGAVVGVVFGVSVGVGVITSKF